MDVAQVMSSGFHSLQSTAFFPHMLPQLRSCPTWGAQSFRGRVLRATRAAPNGAPNGASVVPSVLATAWGLARSRARHPSRRLAVEDAVEETDQLRLSIPKELGGLSLRKRGFVSRAKHASWGPLPYSTHIEELLELPFVEVTVVSCILLCTLLAALDTLPMLQEPAFADALAVLNTVENLICVAFFVEFWLRWYSRSFRPSYILKPLVIIDILAFLPIFVESVAGPPSVVAGFRLLRIFRLQRFLKDYDAFLTLATGLGVDPSFVTPIYLEASSRRIGPLGVCLWAATKALEWFNL